jgi:hypothetical protein
VGLLQPPAAGLKHSCAHQSSSACLRRVGTHKAQFGVFEPSKDPATPGPHFAVTILGSSLTIPQYEQLLLLPATQQDSGFAAAAAGPSAAADGIIVVNALTGITLTVSRIVQLLPFPYVTLLYFTWLTHKAVRTLNSQQASVCQQHSRTRGLLLLLLLLLGRQLQQMASLL